MKRIISLMLSVLLCVGMIPLYAAADETPTFTIGTGATTLEDGKKYVPSYDGGNSLNDVCGVIENNDATDNYLTYNSATGTITVVGDVAITVGGPSVFKIQSGTLTITGESSSNLSLVDTASAPIQLSGGTLVLAGSVNLSLTGKGASAVTADSGSFKTADGYTGNISLSQASTSPNIKVSSGAEVNLQTTGTIDITTTDTSSYGIDSQSAPVTLKGKSISIDRGVYVNNLTLVATNGDITMTTPTNYSSSLIYNFGTVNLTASGKVALTNSGTSNLCYFSSNGTLNITANSAELLSNHSNALPPFSRSSTATSAVVNIKDCDTVKISGASSASPMLYSADLNITKTDTQGTSVTIENTDTTDRNTPPFYGSNVTIDNYATFNLTLSHVPNSIFYNSTFTTTNVTTKNVPTVDVTFHYSDESGISKTKTVQVPLGDKIDKNEAPSHYVVGSRLVGWKYIGNLWDFDNNVVTGNITLIPEVASLITISGSDVVLGPPLTYNGQEQTQTVTVTVNGITLVEDTDYKVTGNKQKDARYGPYGYTLTVTGIGNYTGEVKKTYTIAKANPTANGTITATVNYGAVVSADDITGTMSTAGTFAWKNVTSYGEVGSKTLTATFTPTDTNNYNSVDVDVSVTVGKLSYSGTTTAETSVKCGASGEFDLTDYIADGGTPTVGTITDTDSVLNGTPTIENSTLKFTLNSSSSLVGKTVEIPVTVSNCTTYNDYTVTLTVTVLKKPSTGTTTGGSTGGSSDDETPREETTTLPSGNTLTTTTTDNGDVTLTLSSENGETIAEINIPAEPDKPITFTDVTSTGWYKESVDKATGYGLFGGMGNGKFEPATHATRGMIAQVLYNLSGKTGYGTSNGSFSDVNNQWYSTPVEWAAAIGVVDGLPNGTFNANGEITREQLITMLYRYAAVIGSNGEASADLTAYPDSDKVSDYAEAAMSWAITNGLINGRANGTLDPRGTATRAEVAAILVRFIEYLK